MRATRTSALSAGVASLTIGGLATYGSGHVWFMLIGVAAVFVVLYPVTAFVEFMFGHAYVAVPAILGVTGFLLAPFWCVGSEGGRVSTCDGLLIGGLFGGRIASWQALLLAIAAAGLASTGSVALLRRNPRE